MPRARRAVVIGGSVGGLFAANLLRRAGWDVVVFERTVGELASRGAGIGMTQELVAVMQRVGAELDATMGVEVPSFIWVDRNSRVLHEEHRYQVTSAWARIYRPLKDALPQECYRSGMLLDHVEQDERRVTAIFADGSRADGDILIATDGAHSTVRSELLPEVEPRYAGYVAWRGMVEEPDVPRADRALLFEHIAFCFPDGEMLLSIPIPGHDDNTRRGARRCYFVWYRPADYEDCLPDLCTDATGKRHGVSIPPPLIRAEVVDELRARAQAVLASEIARIVVKAAQPMLQPIFDLESPRMVFGRVALLGDAAFVARPHVVAGVTKAALDAQALADALEAKDGDMQTALTLYDRTRRQFGCEIVRHARYLGAHLEAQPDRVQKRAGSVRPELIMRDYGAPQLFRNPDWGAITHRTAS